MTESSPGFCYCAKQSDIFVGLTVPAFQMKNTEQNVNVQNPKYTHTNANPTLTSCGQWEFKHRWRLRLSQLSPLSTAGGEKTAGALLM